MNGPLAFRLPRWSRSTAALMAAVAVMVAALTVMLVAADVGVLGGAAVRLAGPTAPYVPDGIYDGVHFSNSPASGRAMVISGGTSLVYS